MEKLLQKKWFVILNPHAGAGRGRKDKAVIIRILNKADIPFELSVSEFPRHTIQLTIEAVENGFRKLIVAGGDGTLNEAVNGIFTQNSCPPEEITIGVIPVGTGNDWIKTFGIPNEYQEAVRIIKKGEAMKQDIGRITFTENELPITCYFANMAGFGFDALVAAKTNQLKDLGKSGISLYLQALGSSFFNYQTAKTRVAIDGQEIDELIFSLSIGIGKYNGGGMMQAPGAIPDNGHFQVVVIRKIGIFGILRNLAGLYSGEFLKDRRVSSYHAKHVCFGAGRNIAGEADGEALGDNVFDINLLSQKLTVIYCRDKYLMK